MKLVIAVTLALSACTTSGPVVSQGSSSSDALTPPPVSGQVNACTRSDCGWQSFNPGKSMK